MDTLFWRRLRTCCEGPRLYDLLRPLLFALPPEAAHAVVLWALRCLGALPGGREVSDDIRLHGLSFPNRVGVAAGLDKNAVAVAGLARLGFGFVEVGTVTPRPQPGNPRPRLFRLASDRALINRLGFNSVGLQAVASNLSRLRRRTRIPVGVNIGKNRDTPLEEAHVDYLDCLAAVHEWADYVTVNLSSPNTPGLRDLQAPAEAAALVSELVAARDRLAPGRSIPLLVKVAPDLVPEDLEATVGAAREAGADGFVAVNTTLSRPSSLGSRHSSQSGGLSGRPLFPRAVETVRRVRAAVGSEPLLIGVGGVSDGSGVEAMRAAGADLIQVYTEFVYRGPPLVRELTATGNVDHR